MAKQLIVGVSSVAFAVTVSLTAGLRQGTSAGTPKDPASGVPIYQLDTSWQWPPKLPNNWVVGIVSFVAVDRHDNVWIMHRPRQVPVEQKDRAAPAVLQFDASGKFLQAWGGPGPGYDWPDMEHGLSVDNQDNVWITGLNPLERSYSEPTQRSDDMILKFTNKGKFIKQFGGRDRHPLDAGGNDDKTSVHLATEAVVHPKTNELFVSDGYANRRVMVLDAQTLAFKRMWGAFGVQPPPKAGRALGLEPLKADAGGPKIFNSVHGIKVSNDDLVYVGDRNYRRVQVFTLDGKYVAQVFVNLDGKSPPVDGEHPSNHMTAGALAFSTDPEQRFLYVGDYGNGHVHIVERKTLRVIGKFGEQSGKPGDFRGLHAIAVDSKGTMWTAETQPRPIGSRVQRFILKSAS